MASFTIPIDPPRADVSGVTGAYWLLRAGAALCFIGHGAFGFITKAAWLPYFGVVGIPEWAAWKLMPIVGMVDVIAAMAVLFAPRGLPLAYMTVWAAWTALLRPLAGESVWETVERAGNYGVPLALLMLTGMPRSLPALLDRRLPAHARESAVRSTMLVLRATTGALLFGHGALAAIVAKPLFAAHYTSVGLPASVAVPIGFAEMAVALAVVVRPGVALLLAVAAWKLATEMLWLPAGSPFWEVVERAGSYAAPLALAALMSWRRRADAAAIRE